MAFSCSVQPNGSKLWHYKFRIAGVEGLDALGSFPEVGLAEARELHGEARRLVAQGINPVHARNDQKQAQALATLERVKGSFAAVMADWNTATTAGLRPTTQRCERRSGSALRTYP